MIQGTKLVEHHIPVHDQIAEEPRSLPLELVDHALGSLMVGGCPISDETVGNRQAVDQIDGQAGRRLVERLRQVTP